MNEGSRLVESQSLSEMNCSLYSFLCTVLVLNISFIVDVIPTLPSMPFSLLGQLLAMYQSIRLTCGFLNSEDVIVVTSLQ